jgi:hypothetical protein
MGGQPVGHLLLSFQDTASFHLFFPILQKGLQVEIPSDPTIRRLLEKQFGITEENAIQRIQTLFLNGQPVDDLDSVILRDGDCLALSAAMPGLVGATMRAGGLLAGFRHSISFHPEQSGHLLRGGEVCIKLFNLLIKEMGPGLLSRGALISIDDMKHLIRDLLRHIDRTTVAVSLDDHPITLQGLLDRHWPASGLKVHLRVLFSPSEQE